MNRDKLGRTDFKRSHNSTYPSDIAVYVLTEGKLKPIQKNGGPMVLIFFVSTDIREISCGVGRATVPEVILVTSYSTDRYLDSLV